MSMLLEKRAPRSHTAPRPWAAPERPYVPNGSLSTNFWQKRPSASMNCQKRSPIKKFVKKDHLWVAARLGRRHVSPAAWAKAGRHMPLAPTPACLLTGDAVDHRFLWWALPPDPIPTCWRGTCRLSQCRHPAAPIPNPDGADSHADDVDSEARKLLDLPMWWFFACDMDSVLFSSVYSMLWNTHTVNRLELLWNRKRHPLLLQRLNWTTLLLKGSSLAHACSFAHLSLALHFSSLLSNELSLGRV
jgi:hypothetical protein